MAVNNINAELELRNVQTIDDLVFPMFRADQIKYFKQLKQLYERDRLNLEPEEKSYEVYKLQYNSIKSMERVLEYLIEMQEAYRNKQIINPIDPDSEEQEMMEYFRHGVQPDNQPF